MVFETTLELGQSSVRATTLTNLYNSLIINELERKELESLNLLNANQMLYQLS